MTFSSRSVALLIGMIVAAGFRCAARQTAAPAAAEGDFVAHDFKFHSGESLPELRLPQVPALHVGFLTLLFSCLSLCLAHRAVLPA
jgi:hypothetical protein